MIDNDHACHYVCDYVDDDVGIKILLFQIVITDPTYERNYG